MSCSLVLSASQAQRGGSWLLLGFASAQHQPTAFNPSRVSLQPIGFNKVYWRFSGHAMNA